MIYLYNLSKYKSSYLLLNNILQFITKSKNNKILASMGLKGKLLFDGYFIKKFTMKDYSIFYLIRANGAS